MDTMVFHLHWNSFPTPRKEEKGHQNYLNIKMKCNLINQLNGLSNMDEINLT